MCEYVSAISRLPHGRILHICQSSEWSVEVGQAAIPSSYTNHTLIKYYEEINKRASTFSHRCCFPGSSLYSSFSSPSLSFSLYLSLFSLPSSFPLPLSLSHSTFLFPYLPSIPPSLSPLSVSPLPPSLLPALYIYIYYSAFQTLALHALLKAVVGWLGQRASENHLGNRKGREWRRGQQSGVGRPPLF